jgi:hypothetical protein
MHGRITVVRIDVRIRSGSTIDQQLSARIVSLSGAVNAHVHASCLLLCSALQQ